MVEALGYKVFPLGEAIMVKHGALSKSHVYQLLRSKDARVRRAAFTLLETSNPRLRRSSELFIEITRCIWNANPSYDVYQEFTKRLSFPKIRSGRIRAVRRIRASSNSMFAIIYLLGTFIMRGSRPVF